MQRALLCLGLASILAKGATRQEVRNTRLAGTAFPWHLALIDPSLSRDAFMSFLRSLLVGLCLFAAPAAWAFNPDQADPTVLESIELMSEGLTTWDRGDGPGEDDVALAE